MPTWTRALSCTSKHGEPSTCRTCLGLQLSLISLFISSPPDELSMCWGSFYCDLKFLAQGEPKLAGSFLLMSVTGGSMLGSSPAAVLQLRSSQDHAPQRPQTRHAYDASRSLAACGCGVVQTL